MADLTKLTADVENIQGLSDKPNEIEGLTADQLKKKFDDAAIDIKTYVNDTLTEELDTKFTQLGTPSGIIQIWSTSTAPSGYLLCDGTAVSRTTYSELFAVIGTTYGVGDNSTTFNIPNLKGKVVVGVDATQTEFDTLGETGGAKTHTNGLTTAYAKIVDDGLGKLEMKATSGRTWTSGSQVAVGNATYTANTQSYAVDLNGPTDAGSSLQPYMALNYIIKF